MSLHQRNYVVIKKKENLGNQRKQAWSSTLARPQRELGFQRVLAPQITDTALPGVFPGRALQFGVVCHLLRSPVTLTPCQAHRLLSHEPPLPATQDWAAGPQRRSRGGQEGADEGRGPTGTAVRTCQQSPDPSESVHSPPHRPSDNTDKTNPTPSSLNAGENACVCSLHWGWGSKRPLPQPLLPRRPAGRALPAPRGQGPVARLLPPLPDLQQAALRAGKSTRMLKKKNCQAPWRSPSPISALLFRCGTGRGCSTHLSQGSRPTLTGPEPLGSLPGGTSRPHISSTQGLICISNASQTSPYFPLQLLPMIYQLARTGLKFQIFKTTDSSLPATPEAPAFCSRKDLPTWDLHSSRPQPLPLPTFKWILQNLLSIQ